MKKNYEIIYKSLEKKEEYESTIEQVVNECFKTEELDKTNLYVSITLTNSEEIERINKQYRNIDRPTDVLSFPMFEKEELEDFIVKSSNNTDINVQADILGDIVISIPKVYEQAKEYNHSFERELAYMVVHGFYHLMGYDHMEEEDKVQMRAKEEQVLGKLGITRDEEPEPETPETEKMDAEIDEELKKIDSDQKKSKEKTTNSNFLDAWKNAVNGIIYATTTQRNVKIQLVIAVLVVIVSLFFDLNRAEFLCFLFTIILILFAEMCNTAIETVVDLYVDVYHPKAKIAKDVAAGGVVITAINAIIVAYFLFFDKISDIGLNFIENVVNSPIHLAFSALVIVVVAIVALIATASTNKHRGLNRKFMPSGFTTFAFAINTIIWLLAKNNVVILTLSLVLAILVSASRIEAKAHKVSEVVFSACFGIISILLIYGIALAIV